MNSKIFLATPISGFSSTEKYLSYREKALGLIKYLRKNGFEVCSELESVTGDDSYDSPDKSVNDDFNSIKGNDFFILLHPMRLQTSSLIELGYACAYEKNILIVGMKKDLPYLAIGYAERKKNTVIVEADELNDQVNETILQALNELAGK